jgi:hypothetical protein
VEGFSFSLTDCSFLTDNFLFAIQKFIQTAKYILLKSGTIKNVQLHQELLVPASNKHQPKMDIALRNSVILSNELTRSMNEMDLETITEKKVDLNEMLADKKLLNMKEYAMYIQLLNAMMISILKNADGDDGEQMELYFSCWLNFHFLSSMFSRCGEWRYATMINLQVMIFDAPLQPSNRHVNYFHKFLEGSEFNFLKDGACRFQEMEIEAVIEATREELNSSDVEVVGKAGRRVFFEIKDTVEAKKDFEITHFVDNEEGAKNDSKRTEYETSFKTSWHFSCFWIEQV